MSLGYVSSYYSLIHYYLLLTPHRNLAADNLFVGTSDMMTDDMRANGEDRSCHTSPTASEMSDVSELTDLSRCPSPVPGYNYYASPRKFLESMPDHAEPASLEGKGGFGALDSLPIELRQEIYGLAFGVDK
jgi:hypothetical protein